MGWDEMTVIVPEQGAGEDAAVAAGVALATAVQAAEDAETAEEVAGMAEVVAGEAVASSSMALDEAFNARAAVDQLRDDVMGRLDEIAASMRPPEPPAPPAEDPVPDEQVVTVPPKDKDKGKDEGKGKAEDKDGGSATSGPKGSGYGSRRWFGSRSS